MSLSIEKIIENSRLKLKKKKIRERGRLWKLNNPEKWAAIKLKSRSRPEYKVRLRETTRKWAQENRDKVNKKQIEWTRKNPEKAKKLILEANRKNKEKVNARHREKSKAVNHSNIAKFYKNEIKLVYSQAKLMTKNTGIKYVVDHIMPLIGENFRGLHVPWNLQILTFEENVKKGNKVI